MEMAVGMSPVKSFGPKVSFIRLDRSAMLLGIDPESELDPRYNSFKGRLYNSEGKDALKALFVKFNISKDSNFPKLESIVPLKPLDERSMDLRIKPSGNGGTAPTIELELRSNDVSLEAP